MPKKKFKDTRVGKFLVKAAPNILGVASELLPDAGVLGMVKQLISNDSELPAKDKEEEKKEEEPEEEIKEPASKRAKVDEGKAVDMAGGAAGAGGNDVMKGL